MEKSDFYRDLLAKLMESGRVEVIFPDMELLPEELVEMKCYSLLLKIRDIIHDESLDDPECYQKIEEIIRIFEATGSGGGVRHDFG